MNSPQESGMNGSEYTILAVIGGILIFWAKKINPLIPMRWLVDAVCSPVVAKHLTPLHDKVDSLNSKVDRNSAKIDKVCRVIDHMDGADAAHAAVREEDARWGT